MTRRSDNQEKERTCWIVDFSILPPHSVKINENEMIYKYLDFARELKISEGL